MKKNHLLSLCMGCVLLLSGCGTGSEELESTLSDTSSNTVSTSEDAATSGSADNSAADSSAGNSADVSSSTKDNAEDTTPAKDTAAGADADSGDNTATPVSHKDNPYWSAEYAYLQGLIEENDCMGGVMYIEMVGSDWNEDYIYACLDYDRVSDYAPVFSKGSVVLGDGEQLYALLPAEDAWITVYSSELNENAEYEDDLSKPLYEGKAGEPILLRCNYGDWHSNVYVTVQNGEAMYELRPTMSGKYAYVMTPANGWYDFAPLDVRSLSTIALEWFQHNYGYELEKGLTSGYALEYMGPEYHYNHYIVKFGLYRGMDDESGEVDTYAEYAVDTTYAYKMNPDTGYYEVIGDGMHFDDIEDAEMYIESLSTFENADGAVG